MTDDERIVADPDDDTHEDVDVEPDAAPVVGAPAPDEDSEHDPIGDGSTNGSTHPPVTEPAVSPAKPIRPGHLLFIWSPAGYELREIEGAPPVVGQQFEYGGRRLVVSKVGASPLPGDARPCAYSYGVD